MTHPTVIRAGIVVELQPCERVTLSRACESFAVSLNALRHRYSLSPSELASQARLSTLRLKHLLNAQALPAWDEVAMFAWLFQVPMSTLIRSLDLANDLLSVAAFVEGTESLPRIDYRQLDCAGKAYHVQKLTPRHHRLLDISLSEWPALLPPTLSDALAIESAVMSVNSNALSECIDAVARVGEKRIECDLPSGGRRSLGENLDITLEATTGSIARLQALLTRHRLCAPSLSLPASRAGVAQGVSRVLADVQNPLTVLRAFGAADSIDAREQRIAQLIDLLPSLGIRDEELGTMNPPDCLTNLSAGDRTCAAQMLNHACISLSSIADTLRDLSSLAQPNALTMH